MLQWFLISKRRLWILLRCTEGDVTSFDEGVEVSVFGSTTREVHTVTQALFDADVIPRGDALTEAVSP